MIIVAILLVGGAFFLAEYRNNKAKIVYTAPAVTSSGGNGGQDLAQNEDTDSDGLKDWEEILIGSDPKDPKSKGSLKAKNSAVVADLTKAPAKLEPIDNVSREFFARYMELRQAGLSADKLSQEEIASKTVGGIVLPEPKVYGFDEISLKTDSSKEALSRYDRELKGIFIKHGTQIRNEALIAKEAQEKENPEILKEIDPLILSYENIIKDLLKIQSPQVMSILHLDLINSMSSVLFVTQSLRKSDIDPLLGAQAVAYYLESAQSLKDSRDAIRSYYSYSGIYDNIF